MKNFITVILISITACSAQTFNVKIYLQIFQKEIVHVHDGYVTFQQNYKLPFYASQTDF